jgi:hypothetical protein
VPVDGDTWRRGDAPVGGSRGGDGPGGGSAIGVSGRMGAAIPGGAGGEVELDADVEVDVEEVDAEVDVCVEVDVELGIGRSVGGGGMLTTATPAGALISVCGPVMLRMGDAFFVGVGAYSVTLSYGPLPGALWSAVAPAT